MERPDYRKPISESDFRKYMSFVRAKEQTLHLRSLWEKKSHRCTVFAPFKQKEGTSLIDPETGEDLSIAWPKQLKEGETRKLYRINDRNVDVDQVLEEAIPCLKGAPRLLSKVNRKLPQHMKVLEVDHSLKPQLIPTPTHLLEAWSGKNDTEEIGDDYVCLNGGDSLINNKLLDWKEDWRNKVYGDADPELSLEYKLEQERRNAKNPMKKKRRMIKDDGIPSKMFRSGNGSSNKDALTDFLKKFAGLKTTSSNTDDNSEKTNDDNANKVVDVESKDNSLDIENNGNSIEEKNISANKSTPSSIPKINTPIPPPLKMTEEEENMEVDEKLDPVIKSSKIAKKPSQFNKSLKNGTTNEHKKKPHPTDLLYTPISQIQALNTLEEFRKANETLAKEIHEYNEKTPGEFDEFLKNNDDNDDDGSLHTTTHGEKTSEHLKLDAKMEKWAARQKRELEMQNKALEHPDDHDAFIKRPRTKNTNATHDFNTTSIKNFADTVPKGALKMAKNAEELQKFRSERGIRDSQLCKPKKNGKKKQDEDVTNGSSNRKENKNNNNNRTSKVKTFSELDLPNVNEIDINDRKAVIAYARQHIDHGMILEKSSLLKIRSTEEETDEETNKEEDKNDEKSKKIFTAFFDEIEAKAQKYVGAEGVSIKEMFGGEAEPKKPTIYKLDPTELTEEEINNKNRLIALGKLRSKTSGIRKPREEDPRKKLLKLKQHRDEMLALPQNLSKASTTLESKKLEKIWKEKQNKNEEEGNQDDGEVHVIGGNGNAIQPSGKARSNIKELFPNTKSIRKDGISVVTNNTSSSSQLMNELIQQRNQSKSNNNRTKRNFDDVESYAKGPIKKSPRINDNGGSAIAPMLHNKKSMKTKRNLPQSVESDLNRPPRSNQGASMKSFNDFLKKFDFK
eukprot:TRINITY_DN483_c8_g1_i1.p1 TRINITY_DN483_c8_g1~~TRINITY_DN483_c8_g1_i1.p1  ORF type:complete len:904 (+),score=255.18 TRINITY_DN483_c8_g1_i1:135-2846(+)